MQSSKSFSLEVETIAREKNHTHGSSFRILQTTST